jgi:hypothetical protein
MWYRRTGRRRNVIRRRKNAICMPDNEGEITNIYIHARARTHTHTHTYSMVQSPFLEQLTGLQLVKKFTHISRNPKVHYRTHKRPPPVCILGQPNSVHIPTSHLLEIHPNIHPSMPRSLQWSLSLRFPHQDPIHPHSSAIRATCPAHLITVLPLLLYPGPAQSSPYTHIPPPWEPSE